MPPVLALLGLATILALLGVIMTKRMSPLVALILIPIAAALVGGFGLQTGKFITTGLQNLQLAEGSAAVRIQDPTTVVGRQLFLKMS